MKRTISKDKAALDRSQWLRTLMLILLSVLSLIPFYFMFVNATHTSNEVKSGINLWFGSNLMQNLATFNQKQQGVGVTALQSMLNSLKIAVPSTALSVYFSALRYPCLPLQGPEICLELHSGGHDGADAGVCRWFL